MADRTWWGLNTAVSQRHPPVFPWLLLPHLPYLLPHPIFPFHYNAFPTLPSRNPFPDARRFSHLWFVFVTDGAACAAQAEATLVRDFQQVQQGEAGEAGQLGRSRLRYRKSVTCPSATTSCPLTVL